MFKVQMRKPISFLLPVVFAVFLGIMTFHPLSHGLHHDEDGGHECPVCLWLQNNTVFVSPVVSLLIFFAYLCLCRVFFLIFPVFSHFLTQFSHAPPF